MKSNESLDDIHSFSKRKLIYLCNQFNIPLPMNPTRDILIQSIESYKEKNRTPILTPAKKETPKIENKKQRNYMHTPRVLTSTKTQNLPTPVTVYAEYSPNYSYHNSRSPTPSRHFFPKNSIFYPIDNDVIFYFLVFIIVSFCILLLIYFYID